MNSQQSHNTRFQSLRWKLALSYTGVTVGALLVVEFVLYMGSVIILNIGLYSGYLPQQLIQSAIEGYTQELSIYLSESPPDQRAIEGWMERVRP